MVGRPLPPPGARAVVVPPPLVAGDKEVLTNPLTSSCVIRSLNPLPFTRVRSTPSSRANFRTEGPACAREKPGSLMGGRSSWPDLADAGADADAEDCAPVAAPDAPLDVAPPPMAAVDAPFGGAEDVDEAAATGAVEDAVCETPLEAPEPPPRDPAPAPGDAGLEAAPALPPAAPAVPPESAEDAPADPPAEPALPCAPTGAPAPADAPASTAAAAERTVAIRSPVETVPPLAT